MEHEVKIMQQLEQVWLDNNESLEVWQNIVKNKDVVMWVCKNLEDINKKKAVSFDAIEFGVDQLYAKDRNADLADVGEFVASYLGYW